MSAPEIVRARRQPPAPSKHLGQVIALEADYRARVTVASGTITAHVPAAHRSIQKDDTVEITWLGGDPKITDVITRHAPPAFSATGANLATYSMNTAPPSSAVSGTSNQVTATIDTTALNTTGFLTYDADKFTVAHVNLLNQLIGRVNNNIGVTDDMRLMLHGSTGTTGLKKFFNDATFRLDDIQPAVNTLRTNAIETRNVAATFLKTEGPKQGIAQ